jgi:DegV family protein with EDD domain
VRSGTYGVLRSQEILNRINVFPVADADTGANLVATLSAASAALGRTPPAGIGSAARAVADAALIGARGNSGAIFAQFFDGLAQGLYRKKEVVAAEFALAATAGVEAAYLAVQDPREGTILSVLRAWAAELTDQAPVFADFRELLDRALHAARSALADTPRQLEVLARSRVVDAGGQGFVYFLEGVVDTLRGQGSPGSAGLAALSFPAAYTGICGQAGDAVRGYTAGGPMGSGLDRVIDERFRYCAEGLVSGMQVDRRSLQKALSGLGESLVVAGGAARMRVHLHTNEPRVFRGILEDFGTVDRFKVDDMVEQQTAARAATIALVTDSTFDLPEAAQLRFGTVMVPLTISIGGREYIDRVELDSGAFYRLARKSEALPKSSQPSRGDFRRVYEMLLESFEAVVSVHLSARLSGTYQAALGAAGDVGGERVRVVDSRNVSVGLGLVVEAAGEAINRRLSLDRVVTAAEEAARCTRVYGATPSLEYAVKGGRVGARVARLAGLIELHPVIVFDDEGGAHTDGAHLGFHRAVRGLAERTARFAKGSDVRLAVTHADSPSSAEYLLLQLRRHFPDEDIPMLESGAVLATHTGLGAVAVGVRLVPDVERDGELSSERGRS